MRCPLILHRNALATVLACATLTGALTAEEKRVLTVLESSGGVAAESFSRGLTAGLLSASEYRIELYTEAYDPNRFPGPEHEELFAAFLEGKYAGTPIDLVVAVGPTSLAFAEARGRELFPSVPVVFGAVRESNPALASLSPSTTGVVSPFDVRSTLELALALQPGARRVVFVSGTAPLDDGWRTLAEDQIGPFRDRLAPIHLSNLPLAEVLERVGRLPPGTFVIFLTMMRDGAGESFARMDDLASRIAAASSAPVYGVYETYLGRGVVGGYVDRFESMGAATARLALEALDGEAGGTPLRRADGRFVVDERQLRRWGLDASRLPEGTTVEFQEPSLWSQYRSQFLGVLALLALQTLLIVALGLRVRKRRLELALRESEERYRNVVESQTDLICRYLPDTTLTFVNDAYCRYFGQSREELIGTRFIDLIAERDRDKAVAQVRSVLSSRTAVIHDHEVLKPDGTSAWQQWIDHVIVNDSGDTVELQGIGRDVTAQKLAEREAQQRTEQVVHLTRVAILGELSGALAHELNQPLTAILTNAQAAQHMLAGNDIDMAELQEILQDIVADDARAGEVITRLRTLLHRGATEMQPVDLNVLMREVVSLAHSQLVERHVDVTQDLVPLASKAMGDPVQLQQVMLNLLMNACDALSENAPDDRRVVVRTRNTSHELTVSVTDNGPGIPAVAERRLFEPFFTTKAAGLGLGLSICRSIVAAHGGCLSARNNQNDGATFEFTLPALSVIERRQPDHTSLPTPHPRQRAGMS